jgi:D-serine dehydratase
VEAPRLDWRCKGAPARAEGLTSAELGALGLDLGEMMMPAALLREAALSHNIAAMQAFADGIGARLCPHGKTSMSPELFAMQLAAGAWGMTAATAHHVRVYRRCGIQRVLLANQLIARPDVEWVVAELARDPAFDFYCLVDSREGVDLLASAAAERPLQVLVETGVAGGRTGARTVDQALDVARYAAGRVRVRGVETFEGVRQTRDGAWGEAAAMIDLAVGAARALASEDLLADGPLLLSAGGSAFLDLCSAELPAAIGGRPVEQVIRPGCYVTHDHGLYAGLMRAGVRGVPALQPAMEVWGAVQSLPEPGLAIVGIGKRDVSHDAGLPQPIRVRRLAGGDGAAAELEVLALWDQHASLACPEGALAVGDLVGFGISHPCATFDRWRALFTAGETDRITGFVTTIF